MVYSDLVVATRRERFISLRRVSATARRFEKAVIARRKRAVRSEHQGRALCGQLTSVNDKGAFFGDFLCTGKESYPLAAGQRKLLLSIQRNRNLKRDPHQPSPPTGAGNDQALDSSVFAGTTAGRTSPCGHVARSRDAPPHRATRPAGGGDGEEQRWPALTTKPHQSFCRQNAPCRIAPGTDSTPRKQP